MKKPHLALTVLALAASLNAAAHDHITVKDAWVRGTVAQQKATGLYAQITSATGSRLVAVSSPVAASAEIHEMAMEGDVMKMRELPGGLELPAGKVVELKPGGYHVMLLGLKQALKAGDVVPLTLVIVAADKARQTVKVSATVRALGSAAPMMEHKP